MTSPPLAQQLPRVSALPDLEPAISLRGVSKRYGRELALHSLDLDIADGEFFCLLGPSGCGKTTTLNLLGGFVTPTSGQIFIRGRQVDRLPPYRRDVNTVFQSYALFPHMASASCSSLYWPRLRVGRTTPLRPPPAPCRSTPASPTRPRC